METEIQAIGIYIPDAAYTDFEGREEDYPRESLRFKEALEREHGLTFEEENIGAGADWPAYVTWLPISGWAIAAALALFFSGKRIENNFDSWVSLVGRLSRFLRHRARFARNGAAVLAIKAVLDQLPERPGGMTLVGYKPVHQAELPRDGGLEEIDAIREDVIPLNLGHTIHVFHITAEGRNFIVLVDGSETSHSEVGRRGERDG